MDTKAVPETIAGEFEVPPGYWRREGTHCPYAFFPFFRVAFPVVTQCYRMMFAEMGVLFDALEYREIGGWVLHGGASPEGRGRERSVAGTDPGAHRCQRRSDAFRPVRHVPRSMAGVASRVRGRGRDVAERGPHHARAIRSWSASWAG